MSKGHKKRHRCCNCQKHISSVMPLFVCFSSVYSVWTLGRWCFVRCSVSWFSRIQYPLKTHCWILKYIYEGKRVNLYAFFSFKISFVLVDAKVDMPVSYYSYMCWCNAYHGCKIPKIYQILVDKFELYKWCKNSRRNNKSANHWG